MLREQLTRPACLAYAIWVAIVQFQGKHFPQNVGCGAHAEEPPKLAGPLGELRSKSDDELDEHTAILNGCCFGIARDHAVFAANKPALVQCFRETECEANPRLAEGGNLVGHELF